MYICISAMISNEMSLMFWAYMFQDDLVIKLIDTSARIFNCFVSTPINISLYPISIRQLFHIVFNSIILVKLYQPYQLGCLIEA